MNVVAFAVEHELADVLRSGSSHPRFGAFLDAGSFGRVRESTPGSTGLDDFFGLELEIAARASGVVLVRERNPFGSRARARPALVVAGTPLDIEPVTTEDEVWHDVVAGGDTLALVVGDAAQGLGPLWILTGHGLPVMGFVEPCARAELWNTWFRLAGGTNRTARFLLEEPAAPSDPSVEQALSGRLRELYGE